MSRNKFPFKTSFKCPEIMSDNIQINNALINSSGNLITLPLNGGVIMVAGSTGGTGTFDIINGNTGNINNINTTNGIISNITGITGNISNINSINGIISNITGVTGNISNISGVTGYITNLNTTNAIINNITGVTGYITNLNTTNAIINNINGVTGNISNINSINGNINNIIGVTGSINNILYTTISGIDSTAKIYTPYLGCTQAVCNNINTTNITGTTLLITNGTQTTTINNSTTTANNTINLPNKSGILACLSDITGSAGALKGIWDFRNIYSVLDNVIASDNLLYQSFKASNQSNNPIYDLQYFNTLPTSYSPIVSSKSYGNSFTTSEDLYITSFRFLLSNLETANQNIYRIDDLTNAGLVITNVILSSPSTSGGFIYYKIQPLLFPKNTTWCFSISVNNSIASNTLSMGTIVDTVTINNSYSGTYNTLPTTVTGNLTYYVDFQFSKKWIQLIHNPYNPPLTYCQYKPFTYTTSTSIPIYFQFPGSLLYTFSTLYIVYNRSTAGTINFSLMDITNNKTICSMADNFSTGVYCNTLLNIINLPTKPAIFSLMAYINAGASFFYSVSLN